MPPPRSNQSNRPTTTGHRWQAAMGAITATLVAGALSDGGSTWCRRGEAVTEHAERLLQGEAVPIDLAAEEAIAVAVGLVGRAPPLLTDPATVELIQAVRQWLDRCELLDLTSVELAAAVDIAQSAPDLVAAVEAAQRHGTSPLLTGAFFGLIGGIGAIPARLASTLSASDQRRGRRYLSRLTDRLLNVHRTDWYESRTTRGPREILPGVWLANIGGLARFCAEYPGGLVISLCDTEGRADGHTDQLTFHIDDTPKPDANPSLAIVIDDVLSEVRAARSRAQPVLVHCRHGASRTGLILRLLLVEDLQLDAEAALMEAQCLWPHTSTWNSAWNHEVKRRAASPANPVNPASPATTPEITKPEITTPPPPHPSSHGVPR